MKNSKKGMLLIFGVILLVVGLALFLYSETKVLVPAFETDGYTSPAVTETTYPYQGLGVILVLAGIVFAGIELVWWMRKAE